jgi:hypothetical protein
MEVVGEKEEWELNTDIIVRKVCIEEKTPAMEEKPQQTRK